MGGGPTGEVFRAQVYGVAGFERQFAVKRFHAAFVKDPATAEAIAAAARVYGGLEHPRITRLHEYGVTGGHAFTATELVDGVDLSHLLSILEACNQTLPHGGVAALVSQIARTIGYAHGRGICHLGLCPTNIIMTTHGEARITDFGFLPPRLPKQPSADPSLRSRLPYLAPEQLNHELTSAATDVFQLGAIAYELFTNRPAFRGADSEAVAQSILSGRVPPTDLPKPLAAVLQRCLSRSPFERYPDARALADGMEAATRGLSLAGGLADIGLAVRNVLEQAKVDDEGEMSGAVSFPLPAPPRGDAMMDHLQAEAELPATTIRDPGVLTSSPATPPIPVGVQRSGRSVNMPTMTAPSLRPGARPLTMEPLVGPVEEMDEEMPTVIRERERGFVRPTPVGIPVVDGNVAALLDDESSGPTQSPAGAAEERAVSEPALTPAPPILPERVDTPPPIPSLLDDAEELSGSHLEAVDDSARMAAASREVVPISPDALTPVPLPTLVGPDSLAPSRASEPRARAGLPETLGDAEPPARKSEAREPLVPVPRVEAASGPISLSLSGLASIRQPEAQPAPAPTPGAESRAKVGSRPAKGGGAKWLVVMLLGLILAGGGYLAYDKFIAGSANQPDKPTVAASASTDAGATKPVPDAGLPAHDAGTRVAAAAQDAGQNAGLDAGQNAGSATTPDQKATDDGKLTIRSTPDRAKIYLDGAPIGKTPHSMEATADRHRLALIKPGYRLYTADIQGGGLIEATLQEAAPPDGPGGIKVRCAKKNRYVIFIDGVDTGQLCPSERIGVTVDKHTVEIYDPVTETRREFQVTVKGTRRSVRVRVD